MTKAEHVGFAQGERSRITRQLYRTLAELTDGLRVQVQDLAFAEVESLGDALLDFTQLAGLEF
ncbi:DUF4351 domain-containing protein [Lyngbya confervoides]|uniref:DUF4351 domain-containing protein n=1 Tax=Lyngbya confervoides TaxID=207921 RepID=UPI002546D048|nr:DUF4351 domain-containing protein [Lyngbya confervoides]